MRPGATDVSHHYVPLSDFLLAPQVIENVIAAFVARAGRGALEALSQAGEGQGAQGE